jgi:hypothetical protein
MSFSRALRTPSRTISAIAGLSACGAEACAERKVLAVRGSGGAIHHRAAETSPTLQNSDAPYRHLGTAHSFGRNWAEIGSKHPSEGEELTVLDTLAGLTAIIPPH